MTLQEMYVKEKAITPFSHDGGFTYDFTLWVMQIAKEYADHVERSVFDSKGSIREEVSA